MADWSFDGVGWWSVNLKLRIKMDIKCEIISVIARTLNVEESVITMEMAAGDIEQWDSMGNVAILTTINNELNVDFPVEDLFELNTVGSIVNKVIELKNV